jgi:hypothetical protein
MDSAFPHAEIRLHWEKTGNENKRADDCGAGGKHDAGIACAGYGATVCRSLLGAATTKGYKPNLSRTAVPNVPELSQLDDAFKPKSLGKEADAHRLHIEWRQLKNQVASDP